MHFGQCKKSPPREASLQGVNSIVMHFWGKQKKHPLWMLFLFSWTFLFVFRRYLYLTYWWYRNTILNLFFCSFPDTHSQFYQSKFFDIVFHYQNSFIWILVLIILLWHCFLYLYSFSKISILEQALFQCITSSTHETSRRSGRRNRIRWNLWRGMWELHLVFESDDVVRIVHSQQTPLPLSSACYPAWWNDLINAAKIWHFCKFSKQTKQILQ